MTNETAPLVSVVVPTYEHRAFIEKCIQGIVEQQTSFPVEILIGDDGSTDGTRSICERLGERYPHQVRLFLRDRIPPPPGYPLGRENLLGLYTASRGRFVARCDGDDHWTNPLMLQMQVDVLLNDPRATGCFTNAWNDAGGTRTSYLDGIYASPPRSSVLSQRDMLLGQGVPASTFICRRDQLFPLPEVIHRSAVADTVLYVHLTRNGHLRYLPEHTAVRIMHAGGIHSMSSRLKKITIKEQVWPLLDEMTNGRYHAEIQEMFARTYAQEWDHAERSGDMAVMRHVWPHMKDLRKRLGWSRARAWLNWTKVHFPALGIWIESVRKR